MYSDPKSAAMHSLLQCNFLPKQKGKNKEHCSLGHFLETPVFRSFMDAINDDKELDDFEVQAAYTAGLVAKKDQMWAADSVDFISIILTSDGDTEAWPIEIKSRVIMKTINEEKQYTRAREKFERIDERVVFQKIRKIEERYQLLHHCSIYNLKTGALIIGDRQSEIIQATVVDYSQALLA